jgi:hypothetical protein
MELTVAVTWDKGATIVNITAAIGGQTYQELLMSPGNKRRDAALEELRQALLVEVGTSLRGLSDSARAEAGLAPLG